MRKVEELYDGLKETYRKKNADYGDSFGKSLDKYGLIASLVRISDKFHRFEELYDKDGSEVGESLSDTLLDMANYAVMTVAWMEEDGLEYHLPLTYDEDLEEYRYNTPRTLSYEEYINDGD